MSHVTTIACVIRDQDLPALKKACNTLGLAFRENQKQFRWFGTYMDDYSGEDAAYRNGVPAEDYGKCDHAIGVPGNEEAYEVGLVKTADGNYRLVWDFFADGYGLVDKVGKQGSKLLMEFGKEKSIQAVEAAGWQVAESVLDPVTGKTICTGFDEETGEYVIVANPPVTAALQNRLY